MNRARLNLLIIAAILLFSQAALAQNEKDLQPDPGCESEKTKQLEFLRGEWKVKSRFRLSSNPAKWEETEAESVIDELFPGCVYQENFSGSRDGKGWAVFGLYSYSNLSDSYQWVGGHSQHGVMSLYEGKFVGNEVKMISSTELRGMSILFRRTLTKTDKGFDITSERSVDDGKTWDASWYLSYSR